MLWECHYHVSGLEELLLRHSQVEMLRTNDDDVLQANPIYNKEKMNWGDVQMLLWYYSTVLCQEFDNHCNKNHRHVNAIPDLIPLHFKTDYTA